MGERLHRALGALYAVLSALLFSTQSTTVHFASASALSLPHITSTIGLGRVLTASAMVARHREWHGRVLCGYRTEAWEGWRFVAIVVLREIVGASAIVLMFFSYSHAPLGEATALVFTAPVWTSLTAWCFLGEQLSRIKAISAMCAIVGVALIAHDESESSSDEGEGDLGAQRAYMRKLALLAALLASFAVSTVFVLLRYIGTRMPAVVSSGWYGFSMIVVALLVAAATREPLAPPPVPALVWAALGAAAMISFAAQTLVTIALQRIEAGPVNVLATLEIAFSFCVQVLVFKTPAHKLSIAGAIVIVNASLLVTAPTLGKRGEEGGEGEVPPGAVKPGDAGAEPPPRKIVHHYYHPELTEDVAGEGGGLNALEMTDVLESAALADLLETEHIEEHHAEWAAQVHAPEVQRLRLGTLPPVMQLL